MAPTTYTTVLGKNIRAARTRLGISQRRTVERMRGLGFTAWHGPTIGNVERGERVPRADELLGLAICLETSVQRLASPLREDSSIELPSGQPLRVVTLEGYVTGEWITDERILWHEDKPFWNPPPGNVLDPLVESHDDHGNGPERTGAAPRQASK